MAVFESPSVLFKSASAPTAVLKLAKLFPVMSLLESAHYRWRCYQWREYFREARQRQLRYFRSQCCSIGHYHQ